MEAEIQLQPSSSQLLSFLPASEENTGTVKGMGKTAVQPLRDGFEVNETPLPGPGCLGNIVTGCFLHGRVSVNGWFLGDPMERPRSGLNPHA